MTKQEINNVEEMTNKVVEYVYLTSDNTPDYELQCMSMAAKFLLASFSYDHELHLSADDILNKCDDLANLIISIGQK